MWWLLLNLKDYGFLLLQRWHPVPAALKGFWYPTDIPFRPRAGPDLSQKSGYCLSYIPVTDQAVSGPLPGFQDGSQLIPVKKNLPSLTQTCCSSGPHITLAYEHAGLAFWPPAFLVNVSPHRLRSWSCLLSPPISAWAPSTGTRPDTTTWSANASHWASPTQQPLGAWPPS